MNDSGRIMGLDYGSKTVGVALSDPLRLTAQPFETIKRESENKLRRTLARIEEIISRYDVVQIVLGLPLNMDDSGSERTQRTLEFKEKLEKRTGMPVALRDERLTTVEADDILSQMNIPPRDRKQYIDSIAACLILEDHMNSPEGTRSS